MNKFLKIMLLVLPIAIAVAVFVLFRKPSAVKIPPVDQQVHSSQGLAAIKKWENEVLTPIVSFEEVEKKVAAVSINAGNYVFTSEQTKELQKSISHLIWGFADGAYESYKQFRMPIKNVSFDKDINAFRFELLKKVSPDKIKSLNSNDPEKVFRAFWEYWDGKNELFCTKCLKEAGFDNAEIILEETSSEPLPLKDHVGKRENIGTLDIKPSLSFVPSPQELVKDNGKLQLATVSLMVKNPVDKPYPIYCQFYWVDQYKKWCPFQMATPVGYSVTYNFIF